MADEPPSPEQMVPSLLQALTWACVFGAVDAAMAGRPWPVFVGAIVLGLASQIVGVNWPRIKPTLQPRLAGALERFARNRLYRWGIYSAIAIALLVSLGSELYRRHRAERNASTSLHGEVSEPTNLASRQTPVRAINESPAKAPVAPNSKVAKRRTKPPTTIEPNPVGSRPEGANATKSQVVEPPIAAPPVTGAANNLQASGSPAIIPADPEKAVEAVNNMRNSVSAVLEKKETVTFLMSWSDDDVTYLAFVSNVISSACRTTPRQCWFTQRGDPRDLDRPPIKGSGRRGITVHGRDAYDLARALGGWFTTYSTSSFPRELNSYKDASTKEIMWIEIGPGSPWKSAAK